MTQLGSTDARGRGRSLSPRQARIARRLSLQVGPGPAAFFRDACALLNEEPSHLTVTHLVAHLLRDVESAVRSVLKPHHAAAGIEHIHHREQILAVLTDIGMRHDDAVAELWLGLAGKGKTTGLAARAHRSALDPPRLVDNDFHDFFDTMEQVLDTVLERFEARYVAVFDRLDALLATDQPGAIHAKQLRQNFPNNQATLQYFFSKASSAWIRPLREAGFFASPPAAEVDEDAGTVQFPFWPESSYLARVAGQDPNAVVEVTLGIPTTDNSRVNLDQVEIAMAVPANHSAQLASKIVAMLGGRFGVLIPQQVGALLVHLCRGGQPASAVDLSRALLSRLPTATGPAASVDVYAYAMILRDHVPAVVASASAQAFALLAGLLDEVIDADTARHRRDARGQDGSVLWRPTIDGYESNAESDLRHALVNAVRDASVQIIDAGQVSIATVVAELESHGWLIFRRLTLHLLARYATQAGDLVAARLTDHAIITNWGLDREYLILARQGANCLGAADQRRFLTLIDAGPEPSRWRVAGPAGTGQETPEPLVREQTDRWQRDRLAAVRTILPPEWDARYQALVAEYSEAPDPAAAVPEPTARFIIEDGPVSAGELAAMPTESLVEFLRSWQPPAHDWRPLSPASLRGALSSAVQHDAGLRSTQASSFIGLPPVYIGAVINGLWQAANAGTPLDWSSVVRLCAWIDKQAQEELHDRTAGVPHRQWREPRLDMLRLLILGLNQQTDPIPANDDATIWSIIEHSCNDPDPTPDNEAGDVPSEHRFLELALNTVRPQAVHAAICHSLRIRRREPKAELHQVTTTLDRHLDPWLDPSCAVRTIYGQCFPHLVWMDAEWATQHVGKVFPADPSGRLLLEAAWDGYLAGAGPTDEAWALLVDQYSSAVERMDPTTDDRQQVARARQLGGHLLNRLWFGRLSLDDHDRLLRRFYDRVPATVATEMMWTIGRSLDAMEKPDPGLVARLCALWEFRVRAVRHGADPSELTEFGWWFAARAFDDGWSLRQLLATLSLAGRIEAERPVLTRLADLTPTHTQTCLAVLERWLRQGSTPWRLTQTIDSMRQILTAGLAGDRTAVDTSKTIISLLLLEHGIDMRDLLEGGT